MIVIANPNAQTGAEIPRGAIEEILKKNPGNLVLVDEAYIDFGAESSVPLLLEYDNLLIIQTLSKSRNLAGARIGLAFAGEEIIRDINMIKYSFNPYNLNRLSILAGAAALTDKDYFDTCVGEIKKVREEFVKDTRGLGFFIVPSAANFILAKHDLISGERLYGELKKRGILVRHLPYKRVKDYIRITIGKKEEMRLLVETIKEILATCSSKGKCDAKI